MSSNSPEQRRNPKHPPMRRLVNIFLAGLAVVIPILGTGWVLVLVFKLLHKIGLSIINSILGFLNQLRGVKRSEESAWTIEGFPGDDFLWLLIPLALLFVIGLAVKNRPGKKVTEWMDRAITRVPLLGFIYSSLKQVVDSVRQFGGPRNFKGVAYVEYPSPGCRLLGFITGSYFDEQLGKDVTSVFIPTSPNPMTGFVVIMDDEKVTHSEMTLEEAGKMILSAGLVSPMA